MLIFLNGKFVPEEKAGVSVFDRGFLYGDGLFETMRVRRGEPFQWAEHLDRLQQGAKFLKIELPFAPKALRQFAGQLIRKNNLPESLLRVALSRGVGPRGYSLKGFAQKPTLVMSLHPAPEVDPAQPPKWKLITSSVRLPANDRLAQFKTANRLAQILARAEADAAGADEGLLLNTDGFIIEGSSSNLFWVEKNIVCTPPLASGILAGVTRATILEICRKLRIKTREVNIRPAALSRSDGIFLSLSSLGIVEGIQLNGKRVKAFPRLEEVHKAYRSMVDH